MIPYLAMGAEITTDYHERTRLASTRTNLGWFAGVAVSASAMFLLFSGDADTDGRFIVENYRQYGWLSAIGVLLFRYLRNVTGDVRATEAVLDGIDSTRSAADLDADAHLLDVTDVPALDVPVYVLDGEHELRGRRELALEWFEGLSAPTKELVTYALGQLQVGPEALFSTLGRVAARGLETLLIAEKMPDWCDELAANMGKGDTAIVDRPRQKLEQREDIDDADDDAVDEAAVNVDEAAVDTANEAAVDVDEFA